MIFNQFPDLAWLKRQAESRFSARKAYDGTTLKHSGWPTVILNVNSKEVYRDNIRGPLSLFTNFSGSSEVTVGGKPVRVKEGCFFLSNPDQYYTLEIHRSAPAETFNIHFGEHFADNVFQSLSQSIDGILNQNFTALPTKIEFHNRLNLITPSINAILKEIQDEKLSGIPLEEKLVNLIQEFLIQERLLHTNSKDLPVVKFSTRQEIHKRLLLATDYIYSFYDRDLSLEELAGAACLSKFHFLRLFKVAFKKTPYQFINEVRVQNGQSLLKNTTLEIHQIARMLGFNNASSFSRMFFQQTGYYPSAYRQYRAGN
jgi:AraC family transcriptional regulator